MKKFVVGSAVALLLGGVSFAAEAESGDGFTLVFCYYPNKNRGAIPAGTLKAGDNELVIRNDCAEICVLYVIIR